MILTAPDEIQIECALRFGFQASNNKVEYEALFAGLQLATSMGAQQVRAFSDSQLVVNQILQLYETIEDNMMAYLALIKQVIGKLTEWSID